MSHIQQSFDARGLRALPFEEEESPTAVERTEADIRLARRMLIEEAIFFLVGRRDEATWQGEKALRYEGDLAAARDWARARSLLRRALADAERFLDERTAAAPVVDAITASLETMAPLFAELRSAAA